MSMRIAVCEDEEAAREHLVSLIKEQLNELSPDQDIQVAAFASGEEMLESGEDFDISFLDVEMKEMSGLEVAERIRQKQGKKSVLIFVSGHERYVYDAFDVAAFQYLLKPVEREKFAAVFGRAWKEASAGGEHILVKSGSAHKKVNLRDIYYVESANKKVIIHTKTGVLETYGRMDEWQETLGDSFYRCHRCFLVNMEHIVFYQADMVQIVNGDELIMSRNKYADFVRHFMRYAKEGGIVNV